MDHVVEFVSIEPQPRRRRERCAQTVRRAATRSSLLEKALGSQPPQYTARLKRIIDGEDLAHACVAEDLASRRMNEHEPIGRLQILSPLELEQPCPLERCDDASDGKLDPNLVASIFEAGWIEHLRGHRVVHDIDAAAGVLCEFQASQHRDHRAVTCRVGVAQVVHRHRFGQTARRPDDHRRGPQFDDNG